MTPAQRAAAMEVAVVLAAIVLAWAISRIVVYPALGVPDNAPVILRPILGFFAAWWLLRRAGGRWSALGLRLPQPLWRAAVAAIALYLAQMALSTWVTPFLAQLVHPVPQASFMGYIRGDAAAFLLWVAIGWIVGGFMEEMLFRGFLLDRVATACGGRATGLAIAVIAQAVLFGLLHLYGGAFAMLHATVFALASGVFYVAGGRNLWPLIAVHGVWNTVGIWGVYAS
jgi:membrane protease YdiL (CAAX protease family)